MGKVAKVQKKQNDEGLCQCSIIDCSTLALTRVMCCGLEKRESLLVIQAAAIRYSKARESSLN